MQMFEERTNLCVYLGADTVPERLQSQTQIADPRHDDRTASIHERTASTPRWRLGFYHLGPKPSVARMMEAWAGRSRSLNVSLPSLHTMLYLAPLLFDDMRSKLYTWASPHTDTELQVHCLPTQYQSRLRWYTHIEGETQKKLYNGLTPIVNSK